MLLDDEAFIRRLLELEGGGEPTDEDFDWFESITYPDEDGVIKTQSHGFLEQSYRSPRSWAWRNIMVATVNAGIAQGLFTIRPGDNRWPDDPQERRAQVFRFTVGDIPR